MQTTLVCKLKFKILHLKQCIVETDNNDFCVRNVVIQMQMILFKIAEIWILTRFLPNKILASWNNCPISSDKFSACKSILKIVHHYNGITRKLLEFLVSWAALKGWRFLFSFLADNLSIMHTPVSNSWFSWFFHFFINIHEINCV